VLKIFLVDYAFIQLSKVQTILSISQLRHIALPGKEAT